MLNTYRLLVKIVIFTIICFKLNAESGIQATQFELLDGKNSSFWRKLTKEDYQDLNFYKRIYLKHLPLLQHPLNDTKIPKVIHYIWLGPKSFPTTSIKYVESWKSRHPEWVFKFWTDSSERPVPLEGMEKHLISELACLHVGAFLDQTQNYGEKSDLLRYEILLQEGGVYVDHDIECFQSFDSLNQSFDFYTCLEPPHRNAGIKTRIFPCNGLIGAKPFHPILIRTLDIVAKIWEPVAMRFPINGSKNDFARVMNRTFHSFTLGTREGIDRKGNVDMVFPASFFSPDNIFTADLIEKLKNDRLVYASHKFAATWFEADKAPFIKKDSKHQKKTKAKSKKRWEAFAAMIILGGVIAFLVRSQKDEKKIRDE